MNYIQEMNAFYEDVEAAGLSSKEINLFNALLQINNKARWKKVFTVRPSYLVTLTGQAKSTNERARKELVEKGYIKFEKGSGGKMARYQIIQAADRERPEPLPEIKEPEDDIQTVSEVIEDEIQEEESLEEPEKDEASEDMQQEPTDEEQKPITNEIASGKLVKAYLEFNQRLNPNPKDYEAAKEIIGYGVPVDDAIQYLKECIDSFNQNRRHRRQKINGLNYCVGYILDKHYEQKEEAVDAKYPGSTSKPGTSKTYRSGQGASAAELERRRSQAEQAFGYS